MYKSRASESERGGGIGGGKIPRLGIGSGSRLGNDIHICESLYATIHAVVMTRVGCAVKPAGSAAEPTDAASNSESLPSSE